MHASDRGLRHICPECATKYYDLKKAEVTCPNCGAKPSLPKLQRATRPPKDANRTTFRRYPQ